MSNWILDLFSGDKGSEKTASKRETNEVQIERRILKNNWAVPLMDVDDKELEQQAIEVQAAEEEARGFKKEGAYELGDSQADTIQKDYKLKVEALSDRNLAEMLTEYNLKDKHAGTEVWNDEIQKTLKSVKSGRSGAESKLLNYLGEHTKTDSKEAFKKFNEWENKDPKDGDVYGSKFDGGKQNWEKKTDFSSPSDEAKLEGAEGQEEEKGQVGKEASKDKKANEFEMENSEVGPQSLVEAPVEKSKEKVDEKITKKIDEKIEEKAEEIAEKVEEKVEEHAEEMEQKVEQKIDEKVEEAFEKYQPQEQEEVHEEKQQEDIKDLKEKQDEIIEEEKKEPEHADAFKDDKDEKDEDKVEKESDKGISPHLYRELKEAVDKGLSFEEAAAYVASKNPDFVLRKEDYDEAKGKVASSKSSVQKKGDYQGWRNYETWNVALWIDNDQGLQETVLEMAQSSKDIGQLSQSIKNLLEENMPDLGASMWADLLNGAFSEVNWYEVAQHYEEDLGTEAVEEEVIPEGASKKDIQKKLSNKEAVKKLAALKKVAEVASPWRIIKDEEGNEVIAKVGPSTHKKESEEDDEKDLLK